MKLSYLWKGLPGNPLHPPLTDATIGAYTVATVLAFLCQIGVSEGNCTKGWWLALIAAIAGHDDYVAGSVTGGSFVLTLIGFAFLTLGGWLGGAVVFVHGMRVLSLVDEPTAGAVSPAPSPEKEGAEGG